MFKTRLFYIGIVFVLFSLVSVSIGTNLKTSEEYLNEYKQEFSNIRAKRDSLKPGLVNNLEEYVKFANEIQEKWKDKDKESYARLMLEVCKPLSSGNFADYRRHNFARDYALSALEKPDEIPLELELELIGHVMTNVLPNRPTDKELVKRRKEDTEIRLHAWRRLLNAIDPNWDPNEEIGSPNTVGILFGLPSGASPEGVKDPKLRAEYEAALQENQEKIQRHSEQRRLRRWLGRYPINEERYIIYLYSEKPYNLEELKGLLNKYKIDKETQKRITEAVVKNMEKETSSER